MKKIVKAIGLFSGGLDSAIATKLIKDQGIEVTALNFTSPFCTCIGEGCSIGNMAQQLGIPIKLMKKGKDYIKLIKNPKFGHGKGMNPCIDCRIYILKKAKKYAKEIGADFIFTGEVLDQRPMSQRHNTLLLIEKEAGLKGKLLRPLSAGLLPETEAEKKGLVDRKQLLKFQGRQRRPQLDLASKFKIEGFMCGNSGCRLTEKEFAIKLKDLFKNKKNVDIRELILLAIGRHFRYGPNKIIVGRNKIENERITQLRQDSELLFEPKGIMGPTTLLQGKPNKESIILAASLTAYYSDAEKEQVLIKYGQEKLEKELVVKKIPEDELEKIRVK
jgi:tRNA(Ile)-lysidine synthase TilS/MesJ